MHKKHLPLFLAVSALILAAASTAVVTRDYWLVWLGAAEADRQMAESNPGSRDVEPKTLHLGPEARANLGVISKPVAVSSYWRSIHTPGMVLDRPGRSDRGVTAPAVGVIAKVHAFPGDTVDTGSRLFTLRLISEYAQNAQSELFKTTRESELVQEQYDRMEGPARSGAVAEARLVEIQNQLRRLKTAAQGYRQELLSRGLSPTQVDATARGEFVLEIDVVAPPAAADDLELLASKPGVDAPSHPPGTTPAYEVEELKVGLGQQVQAGQTLCLLSNHQSLFLEGRAFSSEVPHLEKAALEGWPVRVEFADDDDKHWPPSEQVFRIRHLANAVDPESRTFGFYIPLANQSRSFEKAGRTFLIWRFRPGQRVRLQVPVEELRDVIVLPAAAVARQGPEAFVFRQNGDQFDKKPVQVIYEDRLEVVVKNDGSIAAGVYVAQNAAAALLRILKAQSSEGSLPPGFHVHADGTAHGAH